MSQAVDTTKVSERRKLRFESLDDISDEVERLARAREIKTLGNWTPGQVFKHLSIVMHGSIDGMDFKLPLHLRILTPIMVFFMKKSFLQNPMPPGFTLPKKAMEFLIPPPTSMEEGLAAIRSGLQRMKTEPHRAKHPFMGNLSSEEWTKLQCRHCELHLGFLTPME